MEKRRICLLGATGSIGTSTLKVLREHRDKLELHSLAAGNNWEKILPILQEFPVQRVAMFQKEAAQKLQAAWGHPVLQGMEGLLDCVRDPEVDFVVNGIVGSLGCRPTLEALQHGKHVGLANKETMVMAGELIQDTLEAHPECALVPIDSEHSAIFQCLAGRPVDEVESIQLTASGGPFRNLPKEDFTHITKSQALKHPTWVMGPKITIDSATLMNKGLEVIEAHYLFHVPMEDIRVVVHPSSIVHSMVQFCDGSLMAQLGCPDMCLPIQYALSQPERWPLPVERLDLTAVGRLEFFPPDREKFPCLGLAYEAGRLGGTAPAVVNAANEMAVQLFLEERIAFARIPQLIERVLHQSREGQGASLEEVLAADGWARTRVLELTRGEKAYV